MRKKNYMPEAFSDNPLRVVVAEHWSWNVRAKSRLRRTQRQIDVALRRVAERAVLAQL